MTMAVTDFTINVVAASRDACIAEMDDISLQIMQAVGGDPWLSVDDDVQRRAISNMPKGEDDFAYHGTRRMVFQGPMLNRSNDVMPPGMNPQKTEKEHPDGN